MGLAAELCGQRFGRLTVIRRLENSKEGRAVWACNCDCGGKTTSQTAQLNNGRKRSCGCLQADIARSRARFDNFIQPH